MPKDVHGWFQLDFVDNIGEGRNGGDETNQCSCYCHQVCLSPVTQWRMRTVFIIRLIWRRNWFS